ncbi:MAG TPA: hypothetical protein PLY32_03385 [Salinivirgaceae bacterium]|nr:hypothetical protein [Salinivirgaceae bacterium]HQA76142.1 hypothetical protein [Salinivirgaceae bacterium]
MKIVFAIFLTLTCVSLSAQGFDMRNKRLFCSLGAFGYNVEKSQEKENLNFLDYMGIDPDDLSGIVLKYGFSFDYLEKMSADIKGILMWGIIPDSYDISTHYAINNMFDIGLGSHLNKFYITGFEQFHKQNFPDYYLIDENIQQLKAHDLGFFISPKIKLIEKEKFQMSFRLDAGVSSFLKENAVFYHKRKLSNERLFYTYNTKISFQPFFYPKFDMSIQAFTIKETTVGFLLNSNFLIGKRSMNYKRTIQRWTADNETTENIKLDKHRYTRFEANVGLYVKW